jgi:hypothetical protein
MHRRRFLHSFGAGLAGGLAVADSMLEGQPVRPASPPDFTLRIQPVTVELAPKHRVKTTGYNGASPGPILKVPEGKSISIDVLMKRIPTTSYTGTVWRSPRMSMAQ